MKKSFLVIATLAIAALSPPFMGSANALPRICINSALPGLPTICFALFDNEATLAANGRTVTASGTAPPCTPEEKTVRISATIKQESLQTSAQGEAEVACTPGQPTRFTVQAAVPPAKPAFLVEAPVEACAVLFTRGATGQIVDIKHWCSFPTLVSE